LVEGGRRDDRHRIGHPEVIQKGFDSITGHLVFDVETDDADARPRLLVELFELGHFAGTRSAPGGPQVEEKCLAWTDELGKPALFAIEEGDLDIAHGGLGIETVCLPTAGLGAGRVREGESPFPDIDCGVLTFDDGYRASCDRTCKTLFGA
jgi:hypothetical protein